MKRVLLFSCLLIVGVLTLTLTGWNSNVSAAEPVLGFTDTPTPIVTTPAPTPEVPTSTPPASGGERPTITPTLGTPFLPEAGQAAPTPIWPLVAVVGGLLTLSVWLLRRTARLF